MTTCVVNAVHYDVIEDEGGDWFLYWSDTKDELGWILWDETGVVFQPTDDEWVMNLSELSELAGLLRMFARKGE